MGLMPWTGILINGGRGSVIINYKKNSIDYSGPIVES